MSGTKEGAKQGVDSFGSMISGEPFRLFFPTGVIVSVFGASLWLVFYAGALPYAPHVPHARVMIEGFFGAFILGFMGTALPRMMSAPHLEKWEVGVLYALYLSASVSHLLGKVGWGDGLFLGALVFFFVIMGRRLFFLRKDVPPPGFVLAGMGLLGAVAGLAMLLAGQVTALSIFQYRLGCLLLYEGMILFPVLGVGAFFFPRLIGMKNEENFPEAASPSKAWLARAAVAGVCGLVIWGSFVLEAAEATRAGRLLRVLAVAVYFVKAVPVYRKGTAKGTLGFSMRVGVVMIFAGMLATAFYPHFQKGFDHLIFVSGFGLITLSVATRVILGHAGRIELAEGRSRPMQWIVGIVIIAASTRAIADPLPHIAVTHHIYAAILWVSAVAIWAWWLFPRLREGD